MKKFLSLLLFMAAMLANAQTTANRFFYELTFKPKKDSARLEKVMTILDITKDKSVYQDYTVIAQDSIMKVEIEAMQKSGTMKDLSKTIKQPKFSGRTYKFYPSMKIQYVEKIANGFSPSNIGYDEALKFDWKIENDKQKIGNYTAQKASTTFGGRHWTAWFSTELPFQDGPYKFHGLPGLIVKIEDDGKNYSWELKGNKTIKDYKNEFSYVENMANATGGKVVLVSREKFTSTFNEFKKDPFASIRPSLTPEMLSQQIPGMNATMGEMLKKQEKAYKDFYNANNNPVELETPATGAKKK